MRYILCHKRLAGWRAGTKHLLQEALSWAAQRGVSGQGRRGAQDFGGGVGLAQGLIQVLLGDGSALNGGDLRQNRSPSTGCPYHREGIFQQSCLVEEQCSRHLCMRQMLAGALAADPAKQGLVAVLPIR